VRYNQFTIPDGVSLENDPYHVGAADNTARWWMELLTPTTATTIARYHHPVWGKYAAVVRNSYGKGEVTYVGFMPSDALTEKIVEESVKRAGLWGQQQALHFPTIMRSGMLADGHPVHYLLNYSAAPAQISYALPQGKNLLSGEAVPQNGAVALPAWGVAVIEEGVR
jgi:beta-galactosidase